MATPKWPTRARSVFFDDLMSAQALSAAVKKQRIRRLAPRLYTADLISPEDEIVAECWAEIVGYFLPGAVIVARSAALNGPSLGRLYVAADSTDRKTYKFPGLEVMIESSKSSNNDLPWGHKLRVSSPARTLIDNLEPSRGRRGRAPRTLSAAELEHWLAQKRLVLPNDRFERLRSDAIADARQRGLDDRADEAIRLFDQLTGEIPIRPKADPLFTAAAGGEAWDTVRIEMFKRARAMLNEHAVNEVVLPAPPNNIEELAFYESYFSNYIEGTEFEVHDARHIVETQQPPAERPADGHDILGVYRCVSDPIGRGVACDSADTGITRMRARHKTILAGRPDDRPGEWKLQNNTVAAIPFVKPSLVQGTLAMALRAIGELPAGFARALYIMFVIAEVHPFADGNGRIARVMMNAELTAIDQPRIIIPNVFRNEYTKALRRASNNGGDISAFIETMDFAWRWTAAMPWDDRPATEGRLAATNALRDSTTAELEGFRLELP